MTGPEHYQAAECAIEESIQAQMHWEDPDNPTARDAVVFALKRAQVHAILGLAAATALNDADGGMQVKDYQAWREVVAVKAGED
jgi:hypothetical protein